jgi:SNF2 family DNA or RNA helicase
MEQGKRIHVEAVDAQGEPIHIKLADDIPGAYFRERSQRWSIPLGMATCRILREVFGDSLEIGPQLWKWAAEERRAEQRQKALGTGLGAVELPRITQDFPTLATSLQSRPYQTRGARFIADGKVVLVADDPGLGKTTEAIAGIIESGQPGPYLIAAPVAAMNDAWEREIRARLGGSARIRVVAGTKLKRQKALDEALWCDAYDGEPMVDTERKLQVLDRTWIIINIEMIRTKSWWTCPECEAANAEARSGYQTALREFTEEGIFVLAPPKEPCITQDRWEASDKPKSVVIDCGHDPFKVKLFHEHQFPELFDREWGALVMDECQRSLLRNTGKQSQVRNGAMLLQGDLRVALSGTPMRGKPERLWGVLNWLDRKKFSSRWSFIKRFWEVTASGYGGALEIGSFIEERAEIFNTDLDRYVLRRSKYEVSPELPPKAYMGTPLDPADPTSPVAVWLPMSDAQAKAFREMAALGSAEVNGGRLQAVGILAIMTRLKQFSTAVGHIVLRDKKFKATGKDGQPIEFWAETEAFEPQLPSNKFDWIEQFLTERNIIGDPDEAPAGKVIIVSQFSSTLQMFANQLFSKYGMTYARLTGAVTGAKRQHQIDVFNDLDSGVNVMFLNTLAGGVAVTLDAADDMIFLDETHVPDDQKQAEGRNDNRRPEVRVAQRRYWYLKSEGSVEEAIARTNMRREADQSWHLDGRRGVEYAREVFATLDELVGGRVQQ